MQLVKNAQQQGLRCIIDSSGDALAAALDVGNIELVKPNQKELSALVQRDLSQPDDVRLAAQSLIQSGKVRRVVVSLGPQGALGVDASGSVQVVPPPMKSQSTVGAGDSMVGAMTLRLAENASLEDMVRFGVAAGSAATINRGHPPLLAGQYAKKSMIISAGVDLSAPLRAGGGESQYKQDGLCWKGHA